MLDPRKRPAETPWEAPTFSFLVASLGGWLIVVEGMILLGGGGSAFSVGFPLPAAEAVQLGGIGVTVGLVIVAVGFFVHETEGHRTSAGVTTVVLGVVSLASGGGFLMGSALSVAGGLISIVSKPTPLYHLGHGFRK